MDYLYKCSGFIFCTSDFTNFCIYVLNLSYSIYSYEVIIISINKDLVIFFIVFYEIMTVAETYKYGFVYLTCIDVIWAC